MGFPYEEANWAVVDGAMYMGAGGPLPGLYTLISAVICIVVLFVGHKSEAAKSAKH